MALAELLQIASSGCTELLIGLQGLCCVHEVRSAAHVNADRQSLSELLAGDPETDESFDVETDAGFTVSRDPQS